MRCPKDKMQAAHEHDSSIVLDEAFEQEGSVAEQQQQQEQKEDGREAQKISTDNNNNTEMNDGDNDGDIGLEEAQAALALSQQKRRPTPAISLPCMPHMTTCFTSTAPAAAEAASPSPGASPNMRQAKKPKLDQEHDDDDDDEDDSDKGQQQPQPAGRFASEFAEVDARREALFALVAAHQPPSSTALAITLGAQRFRDARVAALRGLGTSTEATEPRQQRAGGRGNAQQQHQQHQQHQRTEHSHNSSSDCKAGSAGEEVQPPTSAMHSCKWRKSVPDAQMDADPAGSAPGGTAPPQTGNWFSQQLLAFRCTQHMQQHAKAAAPPCWVSCERRNSEPTNTAHVFHPAQQPRQQQQRSRGGTASPARSVTPSLSWVQQQLYLVTALDYSRRGSLDTLLEHHSYSEHSDHKPHHRPRCHRHSPCRSHRRQHAHNSGRHGSTGVVTTRVVNGHRSEGAATPSADLRPSSQPCASSAMMMMAVSHRRTSLPSTLGPSPTPAGPGPPLSSWIVQP